MTLKTWTPGKLLNFHNLRQRKMPVWEQIRGVGKYWDITLYER